MLLQDGKVKVKSGAKTGTTFSGLPKFTSQPTATRINVAKIDTWLANIDRQNFILEKTTEKLIGRVNEAEKEKSDLLLKE